MIKGKQDRPRLGRGLNSLIPTVESPVDLSPVYVEHPDPPAAPPAVVTRIPHPAGRSPSEPPPAREWLDIPVDQILPNPHQPRRHFDERALQELAASLKATGLVQPVVVRREGNAFQLIAGERRWRAAKLAGLATLPALVRNVDSITQAQMALVENIQRENLNPVERAEAYRSLIDQLGLTQAELAGRLGEDRTTITNHLRLLELSPAVREGVAAGTLTFGHAKLLASVLDVAEQERMAGVVISQDLSVRNLERVLTHVAPTQATRAPVAATPHVQDLEKSLTGQLGMRVQLRTAAAKGKGKLIIHYSSLDQFDELLARLGVKSAE